MEKNRDIIIDIVKGIGIVMMVLGHSGFPYSSYFTTFHMPLFFIVSGYLYNEKNSENILNVKKYFCRKLKSLWLPYFIVNSIFILLNNVFIFFNIYTKNPLVESIGGFSIAKVSQKMDIFDMCVGVLKSFFFMGGTVMGGTFWFLRALFVASVMVCIVEYCFRKIFGAQGKILAVQSALAVCMLAAGYALSKNNIEIRKASQFFIAYFFMIVGRVIKKYEYMWKNDVKNCRKFRQTAVFCIMVAVVAVMEGCVEVNMAENKYNSIIGLTVVAIAGFFCVYLFSGFIKNTFIGRWFVKCGQNTLAIMILHFLCFKPVNAVQIAVYGYESYKMAAFPVLEAGSGWWLLYALCGICIPVILNDIRKYLLLYYH